MGYLLGLTFDVKRSCQLCVRCHHSLGSGICGTKHCKSAQRTWKRVADGKRRRERGDAKQSYPPCGRKMTASSGTHLWAEWPRALSQTEPRVGVSLRLEVLHNEQRLARVERGTYTRTSFLLSLGRNLILKLLVVTSPGYFLSSKFSCSSSSPSDDV